MFKASVYLGEESPGTREATMAKVQNLYARHGATNVHTSGGKGGPRAGPTMYGQFSTSTELGHFVAAAASELKGFHPEMLPPSVE